jgi:hypothetical protein
MHFGGKLQRKWERTAGSKADGRTAWFCSTAGRAKGTNTDPLLLHAIRTFLSHANSPCLLALFVYSNLLSTGVAAHLTCGYCTLAPIMLRPITDSPALG